MIHKQTIGNELYVYMNGSLLYKRWLDQGHGIIFDIWGNPWRPKFDRLVAFIILLALPFVGLGQSNKPYTRVMSLPDSVTYPILTFPMTTAEYRIPEGYHLNTKTMMYEKIPVDTIPGMCLVITHSTDMVSPAAQYPCRRIGNDYMMFLKGDAFFKYPRIVAQFFPSRIKKETPPIPQFKTTKELKEWVDKYLKP